MTWHLLHRKLIIKAPFLHNILKNSVHFSTSLYQGLHDHLGWGIIRGGLINRF